MKANIVKIVNIQTMVVLMILTSGCSTLDKSMLLGGVVGAGAMGSLGNLATSHKDSHTQVKAVILSSALGGLVGMGIANVIHKNEKSRGTSGKTFTRHREIKSDSRTKNLPDLTKPRIETRWIPGRIVNDKYIEGHFEYIIVEPTHWSR